MKDFVMGFLRDHLGKGSSTRLAGLGLVLTGILSALWHPDAHATTAEVLLAGLAALGIRTRGPATSDESATPAAG